MHICIVCTNIIQKYIFWTTSFLTRQWTSQKCVKLTFLILAASSIYEVTWQTKVWFVFCGISHTHDSLIVYYGHLHPKNDDKFRIFCSSRNEQLISPFAMNIHSTVYIFYKNSRYVKTVIPSFEHFIGVRNIYGIMDFLFKKHLHCLIICYETHNSIYVICLFLKLKQYI